MRRFARQKTTSGGYARNVGKSGVVYILENDGLRSGWVKIGCSSRSGFVRAAELNADANTGTPGVFRCVFEMPTVDCGRAERQVFKELSSHRRGKWGQEFFEVEVAHAKAVIRRVCAAIDEASPPLPPPQPPPPPAPPPYRPMPGPQVFSPSSTTSINSSIASAPIPNSPIRLRWILLAVFAAVFLWGKLKTGSKNQLPPSPFVQHVGTVPAPPLQKASLKRANAPMPARKASDPTASTFRQAAVTMPADSSPSTAQHRSDQLPTNATDSAPQTSAPIRNYFEEPAASTVASGNTPQRTDAFASPPEAALSRADLTAEERSSLDAVCTSAKFGQGALAYVQCTDRHLHELARVSRQHDMSGLDASERQSLSSACSMAKFSQGPAAFNLCVDRQLRSLRYAPRTVDVSSLSYDERTSLDAACSHAKFSLGPAAYNTCRTRLLEQLSSAPGPVDLSGLNSDERTSIQAVCSQAKFSQGPAALRSCLARQQRLLSDAPASVDLRRFPHEIRSAIQSACSHAKFTIGPAEYNRCVGRQVSQLGGTP